jgi:hypothetical protein
MTLYCSSCGFELPQWDVHHVADGSGRLVCSICWNNPCLFFKDAWIKRLGSWNNVAENLWRSQLKIKDKSQSTLFSVIPEYVLNNNPKLQQQAGEHP